MIQDTRIISSVPIITRRQLEKDLPLPHELEQQIIKTRKEIGSILRGDDRRLLFITGPCSVHDVEAAFEYAEKLAALQPEVADRMLLVMRVYFEKPRTSIGWKGLLYEPELDGVYDVNAGVRKARSLLLKIGELGLPMATEWLEPSIMQLLAALLSYGVIGARTAESQTHRQMASGSSMPIGFKNGTGGQQWSIDLGINGILAAQAGQPFIGPDENGQTCLQLTTGIPDGHLILRGGQAGPNYDEKSIAYAVEKLQAVGIRNGLVVDCSHDNSKKDYTRQSGVSREVVRQRLAGNPKIVGVMMESNLNPGNQSLGPLKTLDYGVSVTDACVGWDETVESIFRTHEQLKQS